MWMIDPKGHKAFVTDPRYDALGQPVPENWWRIFGFTSMKHSFNDAYLTLVKRDLSEAAVAECMARFLCDGSFMGLLRLLSRLSQLPEPPKCLELVINLLERMNYVPADLARSVRRQIGARALQSAR